MKQMIWSSYDLLDETAKEYYQNSQREILDDDCYEVSDEEWAEEVYRWLDDERSNLNKEVDGIIVVFGNLGLWNGRRQGYQILGSTIADILKSQCDDAEWYGDGYNIRGRMGHHDGTNYTLFPPENTFPLSVCSRRVRLENKAAQAGQGRIKCCPQNTATHPPEMVAVSFIEWAKHRTVSFYNQLHSFLSLLTEQYPPFIPTPVFRISPVFSSFHHRFGFTRCKGRPSHLIRWLEVHFLQNSSLPG